MDTSKTEEQKLLHAAAELATAEQRRQFLEAACSTNPELRRRLEDLLHSLGDADDFFSKDPLEQVGIDTEPKTTPDSFAGISRSRIGRYKLLQKIGEGGMGIVYMAEQEEPVRRKVALKIIKLGMDTKQVVARFEAERQALAMMNHPNIARVLDGGATETGRPYFVMELVKGIPITEFCHKNKLSLEERLNLFIPVCHAIQSAHQKGIIHRDIKPSNVMVSMHACEPTPKVIDFGVAKAINQKLTEKTYFTNYAQIVGTPAYMSPEQAEMSSLDVDTRSDVYSLGVLLYELLTGTTPFPEKRLLSAGYVEMQRIISEEEPEKPSTRITKGLDSVHTTSPDGQGKSGSHREATLPTKDMERRLKGDLDWIAMRCLEKDRRRRYDTPNELAADLKRHLSNEPVSAAAPSFTYHIRKLYLKNKRLIRAAAVFVLLLLLTSIFSTLLAIKAYRAERKAIQEAAVSKAVNEFLNVDLLGLANPDRQPDRDIKLRTILDRAAEAIDDRFSEQPIVEASIRYTVGSAYLGMFEAERAEEHLTKALKIRTSELGFNALETLQAETMALELLKYKSLYQVRDSGAFDELQHRLNKAYDTALEHFGSGAPITRGFQTLKARVYQDRRQYSEAEKLLEDLLIQQRQDKGTDDLDTLRTIQLLAETYLSVDFSSNSEKAKALILEALAVLEKRFGPDNSEPLTVNLKWSLGWIYRQSNQHDKAAPLLEFVAKAHSRRNGPDHLFTLNARQNIAKNYAAQELYEESIPIREDILRRFIERYGKAHAGSLWSASYLASDYLKLSRVEEAEAVLFNSLDSDLRLNAERVSGWIHNVIIQLVGIYEDSGRIDQARDFMEEYYLPDTLPIIEDWMRRPAVKKMLEIYGQQGLVDKISSLAITALPLVEDSPSSPEQYLYKASLVRMASGIQKSIPVYRDLTEAYPKNFKAWWERSIIEAYSGNLAAHGECVERLFALIPEQPEMIGRVLKTAMLNPTIFPEKQTQIESLYEDLEGMVKANPNDQDNHWKDLNLSFVELRAGRYQDALVHQTRVASMGHDSHFHAGGGLGLGLLIKGMSEFHQGDQRAARSTLEEADKSMWSRFANGLKARPRFWSLDEMIYDIVRKEAASLVVDESPNQNEPESFINTSQP